MNHKEMILILVVLLVLGGIAPERFVGVHPGGNRFQIAEAEKKVTQKKRKILYWRAPMDPTEIYDHPGKSRMGMDLIPVYEGEVAAGKGGTITIDPVTVQNMGIRTAPVKRMDFSRLIRTVGKIDYNEKRLFAVSLKISGWVEKLYVDYTGKAVKKGDPLLEIYSPELVTTEKEYLVALRSKYALSKSGFGFTGKESNLLLESARRRLLLWDIPDSVIRNLGKTGKVQKTLLLNSPTGGIVTEKNVVEGLFVKRGQTLFRIADLSTIWVYVSIYDYELPWIRANQKAKMQLSYLPEKTYEGRISYIYPYLDEKTRTIRVRMAFPNPDLELKPGMYANVILQGKTIREALVVPSEAVIRTGKRNVVFVVRGKGKFEAREIRIGEEGGPKNSYVRVLAGLLEGEQVVTSAQFLLDSESKLQEAIQKMLEEKKQKMKMPMSGKGKETKNTGAGK